MPMASVTISFTLDNDRDHDLLRWLKSQGSRGRSAAIREMLRQGLAGPGSITVDDIRRAIRSELAGYMVQVGDSELDLQRPEPSRAAANLDDLEGRLEDWG